MNKAQHPIKVGVIGLGIMGRAYARRMCEAGLNVCGFDIDPTACERLSGYGGTSLASPAEVAARSNVILLALATKEALHDVVSGNEGIVKAMAAGTVVCEMGTFPLEEKLRMAEAVESAGGIALDAPVSGTGAQAAVGDLAIYVSGDEAVLPVVRPAFEAISRKIIHTGAFGSGIKMKIVANLLVAIHNVAAAEALLLAERSGLDLKLTFDAITSGAGTSRMLEVRGPLMIEDRYTPATVTQTVFAKDLAIIMKHAQSAKTPTPLLAATLPFYNAALAAGYDNEDTASVFAVLKEMTKPAV